MRRMMRMVWLAGMCLLCLTVLGCGGENNKLPAAAQLTITPPSGTNMTLFTFRAEESNGEGQPIQVQRVDWDWTNDGVIDFTSTGSNTVEHLYDTPGTYTLRALVKGAAGQTAQAAQTVFVTKDANPMLTWIRISPATGTTATVFTFRAIAFEDLGKKIDRDQALPLGYLRWDFDGDGIFDTPFKYFELDNLVDPSVAPTIEHQYSTPGVKNIVLQVKAYDGQRVCQTFTTLAVTSP